MLKRYYVNKNQQQNGDHEVHCEDCRWLPTPDNRIYLGTFSNCADAVLMARKYYIQVDGCMFCCPLCHHH
jgi:hypothetical protein